MLSTGVRPSGESQKKLRGLPFTSTTIISGARPPGARAAHAVTANRSQVGTSK
jgi:hypothetical protein